MSRLVVVAAAIVQHGYVLAARRSAPAALAGQWEFPGGKVEANESDEAALIRECREELGVEIAVGELLGRMPINADKELHLYLAEHLVGQPEARLDHDDVRWLTAATLDSVPWLPVDLRLLPRVAAALQ